MKHIVAACIITLICFSCDAAGWSQMRSPLRPVTLSSRRSTSSDLEVDVAIIGSGPAALSLASLLAASSLPSMRPPTVLVLSATFGERWVPNYGTWTEEWAALDHMYEARGVSGLMACAVDTAWNDTDCFFGENDAGHVTAHAEGQRRRSLGRAYLRVSREGLQQVLSRPYDDGRRFHVIKDNVQGRSIATNVFAPAGSVTMHETHTELVLSTSGQRVTARVVVDACGADSPFTIRDGREDEGYQVAYGVECNVEGPGVSDTMVGDYDRAKMTLFDFRTKDWQSVCGSYVNERSDTGDSAVGDAIGDMVMTPTFNYVMPLASGRMFFEETSLVARAGVVSFSECKARLMARLASQGVTIAEVIEEEFCYIPMGGQVPRAGQRVVPVGAAAGVVHPSTGYQLARCLASNVGVAEQILAELGPWLSDACSCAVLDPGAFNPDAAAARILGRTWTPQAVRQRNFALFGGEFLMSLDLHGLQGFFSGFFQLRKTEWAGFLAGMQGLPNNEHHSAWLPRLSFGVSLLMKLPPRIALALAAAVVKYSLSNGLALMQAVTPLVGEPEPFEATSRFICFRKEHQLAISEVVRSIKHMQPTKAAPCTRTCSAQENRDSTPTTRPRPTPPPVLCAREAIPDLT